MNLADALPSLAPGLMAQSDTTGPLPDLQRFPESTRGNRIVMMGEDIVVTAIASAFPSAGAARSSVESYANVLFSDQGVGQFIALDGIHALSDDARGACASGFPDGEGAIAMMAWSVDTIRLDLSVSSFAPEVAADTIWERFSRATFDQMAAEMLQGARRLTGDQGSLTDSL